MDNNISITADAERRLDATIVTLLKAGIPASSAAILAAGSAYFEHVGGLSVSSYWLTKIFDVRDEMLVVAAAYFGTQNLVSRLPHVNSWREEYDVAHMFQLKPTAQSIVSLEKLLSSNCYFDAFSVIRSLQSRLNLLLLCSLQPSLFDHWLRQPKDPRFRDARIRGELENQGVRTMAHLYEFASEAVHGQYQALVDLGYMEQGLFPRIPAVEYRIWVSAKLIVGMMACSGILMCKVDRLGKAQEQVLGDFEELLNYLITGPLVVTRLDHLPAVIAEDRHWRKVGKGKFDIGGGYVVSRFEEQLKKFHRNSGQRKHLSSDYQLLSTPAGE